MLIDPDAGAPERVPHWLCALITAAPVAFAVWLVLTFPAPPAKPPAAPAPHAVNR
jgi:hypothetical protein